MNMIHKFLNAQSCWDPITDWGAASVSELFFLEQKQTTKTCNRVPRFLIFPLDSFYKFFSKIGFS